MANSVETANPLPPSPPAADGFDLLEFWIRNRSKILLFGGLLVVALIIFGASEIMRQRKLVASEQAYMAASKPEEFQKVIADYPSEPAAAAAQLRLSEIYRGAGKIEESNAMLKQFIEKHGDHPLISGAYTGLAANAEQAGKLEEALANYKKVTASYPNSYSAAAAWVGQGRVQQQQGKKDEARHAYETVVAQFPESPFASEAMRETQKVKK